MSFLGVSAEPGTRTTARVPIGSYADGSAVEIPVAVIRGRHEGPTLYLQAGLHGDELTGIDICRRVLRSLDPAQLSGTLASVPLANPPAHRSRTRGAVTEERGPIDANRVFPGSAGGLMTERIVDVLFREFVSQADLALDLHSALDGCTIAPFVYIDPDDDESGTLERRESAAKAFGAPYLYYKGRGQKLGTSDMTRSLRSQADAAGVPSFSAEMGESRRVTKSFLPIGTRGVHNVLRHLGMEQGEVEAPSDQRAFRTITLVHAMAGGPLSWLVELEDEVTAGQPIAEISDLFGQSVEKLASPVDGFILRKMLHGSVATGGEVAWIAS
ncbi:MAG TPA: succinylglutamate desuccinylase/aspartoacylase family protein [Candidatus Limnocylindria bacterium]|nr:succinylglutamate desuccinylase/aspartoacylase family protein [Candidatus Limnocylindria bacterium]